MRIGIVGTSFSQGQAPIGSHFTKPLEYHLMNAMPYEFYNTAASGRGTERYLSCIVHLKQKYSIDAVLLEYATNRSANSYWINETEETGDLNDIIENNKEYVGSINNINNTTKGVPNRFSKRDIRAWKQISESLFYESLGTRIQGINDIKQSWDLCEMLNIKVIGWEFKNNHILFKKNFVPFTTWMKLHCTTPQENWYCDGTHASDSVYEQGAEEYFKPLIVDVLNAN